MEEISGWSEGTLFNRLNHRESNGDRARSEAFAPITGKDRSNETCIYVKMHLLSLAKNFKTNTKITIVYNVMNNKNFKVLLNQVLLHFIESVT